MGRKAGQWRERDKERDRLLDFLRLLPLPVSGAVSSGGCLSTSRLPAFFSYASHLRMPFLHITYIPYKTI